MKIASRFHLLIVALLYFLITLFWLYPISFHLGTLLPVHAYDTYQIIWALWWYRYALLQGHFPAEVTHLYAPSGVYFPLLWTWAPFFVWGVILEPLIGLIGTYNLLVLLTFPLTGITMYLLALEVTGSRYGAFFAGLVLTFAPLRTLRLVGHALLINTSWLPLYLYSLWRLVYRPKWKTALWYGISLALVSLSHMLFVAYFVFPATLVIGIYFFVCQKRLRGSILLWGSVGLVLALFLIAPFYGPFLLDYAHDPQRFIDEGGDSAFSADLLSLFIPSQFHPFVRQIPWLEALARRIIPRDGNAVESTTYVGWVTLVLGVVGAIAAGRKAVPWILLALVGVLFSLGPVLHVGGEEITIGGEATPLSLPYASLMKWPFFSIGRTPGRFGLTTLAAMGVMAAFGMRRMWEARLAPLAKWAFLGGASLFLLIEYLIWWPLPSFPTPISPLYSQWQSQAPQEAAVFDFPMFYWRAQHLLAGANYGMINQTVHERPISGGYITRWPAREKGQAIGLEHMIAPERGVDIFRYESQCDLEATLHHLGFGYVVVHKPITEESPPNADAQARAWAGYIEGTQEDRRRAKQLFSRRFGSPIYEDEMLWAWRVAPEKGDNTSMLCPFVYAGRGWYDPQRTIEGRTFRWMDGREGEIFVDLPQDGWFRLASQVSARMWGTLDFSLDGQPMFSREVFPEYRRILSPPLYLPAGKSRIGVRSSIISDIGYDVEFSQVELEPLPQKGPMGLAKVTLEGGLHMVAFSSYIPLEEGQALYVAVAWRAEAQPPVDYKSFVHLVGPEGEIITQDDPQPALWGRSTRHWSLGEDVWIRYTLPLSSSLEPGVYRLYTGMYDPNTLYRLRVVESNLPVDEHGILLGQFTISKESEP